MPPPRILYSTHSSVDYIPPLVLSERQIIIGPKYPDQVDSGGRVLSINCQREFDVAAVVATLPEDQRPDLFVALIDSFLVCVPRNVQALTCRKVAVIADTHHGPAPLASLLAYFAVERYDRLAVTHDPHHLHWFAQADLGPVGLHLNLNVRDRPQPTPASIRPVIAFVGNTAVHHPRRRRLLDAMSRAGLPVEAGQATNDEAARRMASAQLCFNCSLNGDLNMRVFEALSAGGCLLTDRLSAETGLADLFVDGRDLIIYDDADDLIAKARYYLKDPDLCRRIAESGHQRYVQTQAEPLRRQRFLDYAVATADIAADLARRDQQSDERCRRRLPQLELRRRAAIYQVIQELQRVELIDRICVAAGVAPAYLADIRDLHRVRRDTVLAESGRACLLATATELPGLLRGYSQPPAEFLLVIDADADLAPSTPELRRLDFRFIPGVPAGGGALFRTVGKS